MIYYNSTSNKEGRGNYNSLFVFPISVSPNLINCFDTIKTKIGSLTYISNREFVQTLYYIIFS
jgi:hypothetical protein